MIKIFPNIMIILIALLSCSREPKTNQHSSSSNNISVTGDSVWFWHAACGEPNLNLEVVLNKAIVYKTTFPICKSYRNSVQKQGEEVKIEFVFRPHRKIIWTGYRENPDTAQVDQSIECDIWEAGADPNDLILGIDFMDKDMIYMNTVHIAHPDKADTTEIASGLIILTYPDKQSR